jgi:hypothetical protein
MMTRLHKHCVYPVLLVAVTLVLGWSADVLASGLFSGEDTEKPKPEFTRSGGRIAAKLMPRAKSTSIRIEFEVTAGGKLEDVKGMDFAAVDRPDVDIKNFKSEVFQIVIGDVAPGGTATVAVRSDFFSLSTAFYVFNPKREHPWIRDAQTENRALPDRVRELIVQVQDGGNLDADGQSDGRITVIGGPRDSFWGYALGTLFIRFFGIFIVLCLLMLGMLVSGRVFKAMDRIVGVKTAGPQEQSGRPGIRSPEEMAPGDADRVSEETVAAIAAALYLRDNVLRVPKAAPHPPDAGTAWSLEGRKRIMNDRLMVFHRGGRHKI